MMENANNDVITDELKDPPKSEMEQKYDNNVKSDKELSENKSDSQEVNQSGTSCEQTNQSEASCENTNQSEASTNQQGDADSANESGVEEWSSNSGDSDSWEYYYTDSEGSADEMGKKLGLKHQKGFIIYSKEEFKEEYPAAEKPEKKKKKHRFLRRRRKKKKDGEEHSECSVYSEYAIYTNSSFHDDELGRRRKSMNDYDSSGHVVYIPDANERAIDVPGVNNDHADAAYVNETQMGKAQDVNEKAVDVPAGFMHRMLDEKQRREKETIQKEDEHAQRIEADGKSIPYERLRNEPSERPPTRPGVDQTQPPKKPPRVKSACSPTEEKQILHSFATANPEQGDITYYPAEQQVFVSPPPIGQSYVSTTDQANKVIPPPKPKRLSQTQQDSVNNNSMTVAQVHVNNDTEKQTSDVNQDIVVMDNIENQLNESLTVESVMKELDDTISQASEELVIEELSQQQNDIGTEAAMCMVEGGIVERGANQDVCYVHKEEVEYGRTDDKMKLLESKTPKTPPPTPASEVQPVIRNLVIPYKQLANLELKQKETKAMIGSDSVETVDSPNGRGPPSSTPSRRRTRSRKSSKGSSVGTLDDDSDDDEDGGIYDESYRQSTWIYVGENDEPVFSPARNSMHGSPRSPSSNDSGFSRDIVERGSTSTTASEAEFQMCYQSIARRRRIIRSDSTQDYSRVSLNFRERTVVINKKEGQFGFRIQYSRPVRVTGVDKDGAAEDAGLQVGDAVLEVNGKDTTTASHFDVVKLIQKGGDGISLVVGTRISNALNLPSDQPIIAGFLHKQGQTGLKLWKKRYFVLKHDHCLYYYKTDKEKEPVGAIVLPNYTVTKAHDCNREFTFKLTKYGSKTYYLQAANEEEMSRWASGLSDATNPKDNTDPWLGINTHNVRLPAYSIANPECHGFLYKMGGRRKNWRRRYCVLKDACLYYYTEISATTAQGVAHFHGYSIQETEFGNKKFAFTLKPPHPEMRTWCFNADHDVDRKRWIAALAESIGHWICMENLPTGNDDESEYDEDGSAEYEDM